MKVTIEIDCDNDAFQLAPEYEVNRILLELAWLVRGSRLKDTPILDSNGNTVGKMVVTK